MEDLTLVEFRGERRRYRCGYCGNQSGKLSHGMPTHFMSVVDYQALIDRGWRRSGSYCYKPIMDRTCCPQYTIRCRALEFGISKSKKKILNKMRSFLTSEIEEEVVKSEEKTVCHGASSELCMKLGSDKALSSEDKSDSNCNIATFSNQSGTGTCTKPHTKTSVGADPLKPLCKKAKLIRQEKKKLKDTISVMGEITTPSKKINPKPKPLRELISHLTPSSNFKRKLEIRTVCAKKGNRDFEATKKESHDVYRKYQCAVHGDSPMDCSESQWMRFLVECSLYHDTEGPGPGYGNFHQQYVLDGKIIAVGVIDILPSCISSVYFYYDPDYGFLSLGVYSALSEIAYTQALHDASSAMQYYYMGFYIHNCQKMNYKGAYRPSDLLCPETYKWVPIDLCLSTLEQTKYSRLNILNGGSPEDVDEFGSDGFNMDELRVVYGQSLLNYGLYVKLKYYAVDGDEESATEDMKNLAAKQKRDMDDELIKLENYVSLVGSVCAQRMFLFRAD